MKVDVFVDGINRTLAFNAPDDIAVGDTVFVPVMSFITGEDTLRTGTVERLGTCYNGYCKSVRKVVRPEVVSEC